MHRNWIFAGLICMLAVIASFLVLDLAQNAFLGMAFALLVVIAGGTLAYFLSFALRAFERAFLVLVKRKFPARLLAYALGATILGVFGYVFVAITLPDIGKETAWLAEALPAFWETARAESTTISVPALIFRFNYAVVLRSVTALDFITENLGFELSTVMIYIVVTTLVVLLGRTWLVSRAKSNLNYVDNELKWRILSGFSGIDAILREYFNTRVMVGGLVGVIFLVLFNLFDAPCPILFSTLAGITFLCPYFGAIFPLVCVVTLGYFELGYVNFTLLFIGLAVCIVTEVLLCFVVPSRLNVSVFAVGISVLVGAITLGIVGVVLFPMLFSVMAHAVSFFIRRRVLKYKN